MLSKSYVLFAIALMKRFNTMGTCRPNEHYMVDITERLGIIREMVVKGERQLFEYLALKKHKTGYLVSFCFNKGKTPGLLPSVEHEGRTLVEVIV